MDAIAKPLTVSSLGKRKMSWRQSGSLVYKVEVVEGEADFGNFQCLAEACIQEQMKSGSEKEKQRTTTRRKMNVSSAEDASRSNGGEPVLEEMNIRQQEGQQAVNTVDKKPLAVQEALPLRWGARNTRSHVRRRRAVNMRPPARRERELDHLNPTSSTRGGPLVEPVNNRPPAGQQDVISTRSGIGRPSRPTPGQKPAKKTPRALRKGGRRTKSSLFKGVTHYQRTGRWEANIWHNGKQKYLGASATEIQAARAYDRALIHFRGASSELNFNVDDYNGELRQLSTIRSEDLVTILRRQSKGVGRPMPDYSKLTLKTSQISKQEDVCNSTGNRSLKLFTAHVKLSTAHAKTSPIPCQRDTIGLHKAT